MILEIFDIYKYSIRKSIIDYILIEASEKNRLGCHTIFKPIKSFGHE
jgi:hypothetical protein